MLERYILKDHEPVRCEDMQAWGEWMSDAGRWRVAHDTCGPVRVSTIFLGIDHAFKGIDEGPLLFETVIVGGEFDKYMARCGTWADALDQHAGALKLIASENVSDEDVTQ
jgi:hypothetical protein